MVVLALLCSGPAVAELVLLWLTGLSSDRALAAQVTSPAPWGQFHDLRWLLVFHDSWLSLALGAVAMVVLRSGIDALIVRAAWPGDDAPRLAPLLRRLLVVTPVMWLFLLPWTVLGFGMGVVSISWLFFTAIPPVLVVALVCGPAPVTASWWRRPPPRAAVSTAAIVFGVQSLVSLSLSAAPAVLWVPIVAVAGAGNGWAWRRMTRAVALDRRVRRPVPVAPIVSVGMVAVAVSGAAIAFAVVGARHPAPAAAEVAREGTGPPVLVVSGFDSRLDSSTPPPPVTSGRPVRFSYRGADALGRPRPYAPGDTHRSLPALVRLLAYQVGRLHASSGQKVAIVAESEGSLVTQVYLAVDPGAPVSRAILLSPLDQPARVYYPPPGRSGYGLATGDALESLTYALGGFSPVHLPADGPFLRSIVDHAPSLRGLLSCPPPVPEDILEPLADALADPSSPPGAVPTMVVPAFHGGLLSNPAAQRDVDRLLMGGRRPAGGGAGGAAEAVLRGAAAGWQVPTLPLSLYTSSPDHPSCAAMTSGLRRWVDTMSRIGP